MNANRMSDTRISFHDDISLDLLADGRWRALSGTFCLATYGENRDDAKAKNDAAVSGVVKAMVARGGLPRVTKRFRLAGVPYRVMGEGSAIFSETRELDLGAVGTRV